MTSATPQHQQVHPQPAVEPPMQPPQPPHPQHPQHGVQVWTPPLHEQQRLGGAPPVQPVRSGPVEPQAVVSLVLGSVSLLCCWIPGVSVLAFLASLAAVITGVVALRRLRAGDGAGKALAITGLSCGSVAAVVSGVFSVLFVLYVALFGGLWTMAWGTALS